MKESKMYKLLRPIIKITTNIFLRPKYEGLENIPKNGKIILAGTHTNNLDCLLIISSTNRAIHFLAKDELWKGMKKIIFSNMGLIPVNRRQKDKTALKLAKKYLDKDKVVCIFPEGTTEKVKGKLLPFKIGTVKLASDTKTKIVPFVIKGDYKIFSKNLIIRYGTPIEIKNEDLEKENKKFEELINKMNEV